MQNIPPYLQLALNKSDGMPLTNDEIAVCEEWTTGVALENMKVNTGDPRILEYAAISDKLDKKKEKVWKKIADEYGLTKPNASLLKNVYDATARIILLLLGYNKLRRKNNL